MQHVAHIELTSDLAETSGTTTPVWQSLLHGRVAPILRECGWKDIHVHAGDRFVSVDGKGAWHRRSEIQFIETQDGTGVDAYADTRSDFAKTIALNFGGLLGMIAMVALVADGQGSLFGMIALLIVWLVAVLVTYPVWWLIGKLVPFDSAEAEGYALGLLEVLKDDEAVAAEREALAVVAAQEANPYGAAEITEADLEPEDRTLSLDALERKYGLVKGGQVYAFINTRQDED